MVFDPEIHHRRSIRLKDYDYTKEGMYFVTICVHKKSEIEFGKIVDAKMNLNEFGKMVEYTWFDLVNHIQFVELDAFVIMPDHIHGIIIITDTVDKPVARHPIRHGLGEIRQLKTFSAKRINKERNTTGNPVWQRNYYEHIIRNEESYSRISEYIKNNPAKWEASRKRKRAGITGVRAGSEPAPTSTKATLLSTRANTQSEQTE